MGVGLGGFQSAQASLYHALEVFRKGGAIVWHQFFHRRIKIHQLGSIPRRHLWTYTDRPRVCLTSAIFAPYIFAGGLRLPTAKNRCTPSPLGRIVDGCSIEQPIWSWYRIETLRARCCPATNTSGGRNPALPLGGRIRGAMGSGNAVEVSRPGQAIARAPRCASPCTNLPFRRGPHKAWQPADLRSEPYPPQRHG